MRPRLVLSLAVFLALAACNQSTAPKAGAARAPVPAQTASPAACPPAPSCPTMAAKTSKATGAKAHVRRATKVSASHQRSKARRTVAAERYSDRHQDLAGGPRPYARYHAPRDEPRDDYSYDDGVRFSGGPAFEERDERYSGRRYYNDGRSYRDHRRDDYVAPPPPPERYERPAPPPVERYERYERPAPPPPPRYRDDAPRPPVEDRYSGGRRYEYESGRTSGGVYGERSRSESYYESESHSSYGGSSYRETRSKGPCCVASPGAAGFDGNGFLTWPGKVPARP